MKSADKVAALKASGWNADDIDTLPDWALEDDTDNR